MEKTELIPISVTGDKDNRINVVIVNQWTSSDKAPYNSPEMRGEFVKDIEESLVAALTYGDPKAQTAYSHYKEFFNVYGLWAPHMPEFRVGVGIPEIDAMRDKLFLPWKDEHRGWITFLIMPNRESGGGGAARNLESRYGTAVIAGNGIGKMLHEISHTCMSLGDEYTTGATGTSAFPTYAAELEYEREKMKWRKWVDPSTPLPTPYEAEYKDKIGAFEGNQYHLVDYYRSTAQGCIMGAGVFDNTEHMCPICNQRVSMRAYDLVDPVNSFTPSTNTISISGKKKMHFSVDHIKPEPNTQVARWYLNGKLIATGTSELDVEFGEISNYELVCSITDETPTIKPDPPFAVFPQFDVAWTITNTAPTSSAKELSVRLSAKQKDKKVTASNSITPKIYGGKAPYTYIWSDGSTSESLENVGIGIYDVTIIDSEFRTAKAHYSIYESSLSGAKKSSKSKKNAKEITVLADIKASDIGKDNGSVALSFSGGTAPYNVQWQNARYEYGANQIYEAEEATFNIPEHDIKTFFNASENTFVNFKGNEGKVTWNVEVANSGMYPVEVIYAGIDLKGSNAQVSVNGKLQKDLMHFNQTRPLFTGWDYATVKVYLDEGFNTVSVVSNGESIPNLDYLRLPSSAKLIAVNENESINLAPGDYSFVVTDANNLISHQTITIPEVYAFEVDHIDFATDGEHTVKIENPIANYSYKWYAKDANNRTKESYETPISTGTTFSPKTKGNYYVAVKNNLTHAESVNRIGFAVGDLADKRTVAIDPSELERGSILFWLDATDIDGDRKEDVVAPARGPVSAWKDKSRRSSNALFTKYEPNKLNGKGVAGFDQVWLSIIDEEIKDYQTVIMVYKESSMSFPGSSLFQGLETLMGKSENTKASLFDESKTSEKTKNGSVYLNGKKVNPFTTSNPMDYCLLTVQLDSKSGIPLKRTQGLWEADLAEFIVINRALEDWERKGIEEYLRRKWLAKVDLKF
ncbi:M64 family metallopeptidase [Formosa sp. 3Alg 14/1]|uniref:M64 family metallopeptidase n=1 Tax=Formosa sp. 3Alg 14/1 TaxID=3382190 RepID=UPI0039BE65AD